MSATQPEPSGPIVDELDHARAQEYALLATLLSRSPDIRMLTALTSCAATQARSVLRRSEAGGPCGGAGREYFELFGGLGQGALLPMHHYLAGTLYGRPLARLREALQNLGIERAGALRRTMSRCARSWPDCPRKSRPWRRPAVLCNASRLDQTHVISRMSNRRHFMLV